MELLTQFWEDVFEERPIEAHRQSDGEIQFTDTGDEWIDKWEEQMARGEIPDLAEVLDEDALQRLHRLRQNKRHSPAMTFKDVVDQMRQQAKTEGLDDPYDRKLNVVRPGDVSYDALNAEWKRPKRR